MPRFVSDSETKAIQAPWWAEKETCTIRRFNYGDRQWLAGQTMTMGIKPDKGAAVADLLIDQMNLAVLQRGIVRWTDEAGDSIPVTSGAIERLEERDAEFILEAIQAMNPSVTRSEEEQATFRGEPGDRAAE